jgi:hypothetical protein
VFFGLDQVHHQLFTQAAILRQQVHQPGLLQHHLGGHAHQFAIFTQRFWLACQADNPYDFTFQAQRQVYPLTYPVQMSSNRIVDIHHAPLREHQQRAFVQFPNTFTIATANDSPTGIHYVDVRVNNAHGSCHDILRHFGIKMPASHVALL